MSNTERDLLLIRLNGEIAVSKELKETLGDIARHLFTMGELAGLLLHDDDSAVLRERVQAVLLTNADIAGRCRKLAEL